MDPGTKEERAVLMREEEKRQLKVLLRDYDARYDGQLCLLGEECHSRGYHTQMKTGSPPHLIFVGRQPGAFHGAILGLCSGLNGQR